MYEAYVYVSSFGLRPMAVVQSAVLHAAALAPATFTFTPHTGGICVRIYFSFMSLLGVFSTSPILVTNNSKFGVPKLIRLKVICN